MKRFCTQKTQDSSAILTVKFRAKWPSSTYILDLTVIFGGSKLHLDHSIYPPALTIKHQWGCSHIPAFCLVHTCDTHKCHTYTHTHTHTRKCTQLYTQSDIQMAVGMQTNSHTHTPVQAMQSLLSLFQPSFQQDRLLCYKKIFECQISNDSLTFILWLRSVEVVHIAVYNGAVRLARAKKFKLLWGQAVL